MLSIREVKQNGTRQIITGTIEKFNSYLKVAATNEDEVLCEMRKAFPRSTFEFAKRITKGTKIVYVKMNLKKLLKKKLN